MDKEKQIEEMAKCCTYYHNGECCADATNICNCDLMCEMFGVFTNLENAGYRKESKVVQEVLAKVKSWLYQLAFNNVGNTIEGDFADACEIIISRLYGLETFIKETKGE